MSKVGDESGKRDFQKIEFMGIYGWFDVGHEGGRRHQDACAYDLGKFVLEVQIWETNLDQVT